MTEAVRTIIAEASEWDGVEAGEHRFGGTEFTLGAREIGHVHRWGILDIAFPRRVRDELVAEGRTEPHHIYPKSGWTTFHVEDSGDVEQALWLLRLSYLFHASAIADTPDGEGVTGEEDALSNLDVDSELSSLGPSDELRALL